MRQIIGDSVMRALVVFLTVFTSAANAGAQPACTTRAIAETRRFQMTSPFVTIPEVGTYENPYDDVDASIVDYEGPFVRTEGETIAAFHEAREILIADIAQGASESQLTEKQKLLIARLRNLKVRVTRDQGTASNSMDGQYVTLDLMARTVSKTGLVAMIGHELGHSLDLCNLSDPYYRVDYNANIDGSKLTRSGEPLHDLATILRLGASYMIVETGDPARDAYLQSLVVRGIATPVDFGIANEYNPTYSTYRCLVNGGYSPNDLNGEHCESEATAQVWGARTLGAYLKGRDVSRDDIFVGMMGVSMMAIKKDRDGNPHPFVGGKERDFDEIYLSQPEVQRALGCTPVEENKCMSHFTYRHVTGSVASGLQQGSGASPQSVR